MSNNATSNETDLDWLARNVHVWHPLRDLAVVQHDDVDIYVTWPSACSEGITKAQWLARCAELQNKPSWEDAPEWAEHMSQSPNGHWKFFSAKPIAYGWWRHPLDVKSKANDASNPGLILGDWRDTLENRPSDLSEQAVTARLKEAINNVLAAAPEMMTDKYRFEPFVSVEDATTAKQPSITPSKYTKAIRGVSVEDNQEHEMKQDNGWFERGDLPPVGSQCEVMHRDSWVVCGVIAHFQQKAAMVAAYTVDNGNALKSLDSCIAKYFRPIRTERDVLADLIESHGQMSALIVADAIIAAGFKLEAK